MPELFIIGGPNGAGKTTTALTLFPRLGVTEFVNADSIAAGISPLNPAGQARLAGRLMLERLDELSGQGMSFALETTLASRSFVPFIHRLHAKNYTFHLIYIWLENADLAVSRVAKRVASGGHHIPEDIIRRRYERGLSNFFRLYMPIAHTWSAIDNTSSEPQLVAQGGNNLTNDVLLLERWDLMESQLN